MLVEVGGILLTPFRLVVFVQREFLRLARRNREGAGNCDDPVWSHSADLFGAMRSNATVDDGRILSLAAAAVLASGVYQIGEV